MSIDAMRWAKRQQTGSATRKAVLMALADYADEHGVAWPSQARVAEETELSERSVRYAIADLEEAGFLERATRRRSDGTRNTDKLHLRLDRDHRQDLPVDAEQPANYGRTTGKSGQNHRQMTAEPPAPVAGKPSLEELPLGNHQKNDHSEATASDTASAASPVFSLRDRVWLEGVPALMSLGKPEKQSKQMVGRWMRDTENDAGRILWCIEEAVRAGTGDPFPYVTRLLSERRPGNVASFGAHSGRRAGPTKDDNIDAAVAEFSGGRRERPGGGPGYSGGRGSGWEDADLAGSYDADTGATITYLRAHH